MCFLKESGILCHIMQKLTKIIEKKCKTIGLKFTLNELDFYENIVKHCENNNLSLQGYIKNLIRKDLDK